MGGFGEVTYDEGNKPIAAGQDAAPQAIIDENDPALTSENIAEDVTGDPYAIPPPPDGKWRAKLKLTPIKDAAGKEQPYRTAQFERMNQGKPFFVVNVGASLIDLGGKFDGVQLVDYWVKSAPGDRVKISQMTFITQKAGGVISEGGSPRQKLDALVKALAGEPEVIVETVWHASCEACQKKAKDAGGKAPRDFLVGESRFPQPRTGGHDPFVKCPACGTQCRAQARIGGYFSVKEAKATRGLA